MSPVANLAPKIVRNSPTEEDVAATLKSEPMKKIAPTASNMPYPAQISGTIPQIVQKKTEIIGSLIYVFNEFLRQKNESTTFAYPAGIINI